MSERTYKLHWADYLVFAVSLAISLIVGIIFAVKDKWHKASKESYLMANRRMLWFFVGLSTINTFYSTFSYIIVPAEYIYFGDVFVFAIIAFYIAGIILIVIVIPKFYRLGFLVTSIYEYFEHRFNLPLRMLIGFVYIPINMLYMAVALYVPGLVLAQVSDLSLYWCIAIGGIVCLIYTAFGGMKAVIFVDSIQILIIVGALLTFVAKGVIDAGGMGRVWEIYSVRGERNNWRDLNPEPWNRHNIWNVIFLVGLHLTAKMAIDQASLQRSLTVKTMRKSQLSAVVAILVSTVVNVLIFLLGLVTFAHLGGNDPLLNKQVDSKEQIIPYFMMYLLGHLHGIPGLVVAAMYAASLSTLSSMQTSTVAVFLEDIVQPVHKMLHHKDLSEKHTGILARVLGVIVGLIYLGIAMIIPLMSRSLFDFIMSISSFNIIPMFGLLICGFFLFWVESWGAIVGFVLAVGWNLMMYFGRIEYANGIGLDRAPLFTNDFANRTDNPDPTVEPGLFDVSYTWYHLMGVLIVTIASTVVSIIVHCCQHGRLRASDMMPDKHFRYTKEDFLVAIGCRKNKQDDIRETNKNAENAVLVNGACDETHL